MALVAPTARCSTMRLSRRTILEFLIQILLISIVNYGNIAAEAARPKRTSSAKFMFVCIPSRIHFLPLSFIAEELLAKGYTVSFAIPNAQTHWVPEGIHVVPAGESPESMLHADFAPVQSKVGQDFMHSGRIDDLEWAARYHNSMFQAIWQYANSSIVANETDHWPPDVLVVDRYTLAGIDVAHKFGIPFAIHNPILLFDIDDPPMNVPAPYSGIPFATTRIWEQVVSLAYRIRFRLAMTEFVRKQNTIRIQNGLEPIPSRKDNLASSLVLSSTAFGIEHPRPIAPLTKLIGYILPGKASTVRRANERGVPRVFQPIKSDRLGTSVEQSNGRYAGEVPLKGPNSTGPVTLSELGEVLANWLALSREVEVNEEGELLSNPKRLVVVEWSDRFERSVKAMQVVIDASIAADHHIVWCGSFHGDQKSWDKLLLPTPVEFLRIDSEWGLWDVLSTLPKLGVSSSLVPVISNGDLHSVQTALVLYHPLILVPLHPTQNEVALRLERTGAAIRLTLPGGLERPRLVAWAAPVPEGSGQLLSPETLKSALNSVVTDRQFPRASVYYGTLLRSSGGLKEATSSLISVATYGTSRLVPESVGKPWYKVMMLDVYYLYLSAFVGIAVVLKTCWATCWSTLGTVSNSSLEHGFPKTKRE